MSAFRDDLLRTLPPGKDGVGRINSWWLYDQRGSELFEQITTLPEYYPTRTEAALFSAHAPEMAEVLGSRATLIEYGAGAAVKTRQLLDALDEPHAYHPVDVAEKFLHESAAGIARDYPGLIVQPVVGSFLDPLDFGADGHPNPVGFFPGSTIGNLVDAEIVALLRHARAHQDRFLLGVDLAKDAATLVAAYDDSQGVTAAFNLNLLERANREAGADFDVESWRHVAEWNGETSQMELYLEASADQTVTLGGKTFSYARGDRILNEISRKFTPEGLAPLFAQSGWRLERGWFDAALPYAVLALN